MSDRKNNGGNGSDDFGEGNDGNDKDDYEVGYMKPPKNTQYKKGTSGNPKGRPKKPDNLASLLKMIMDEKIVVRDAQGKVIKMSNMEAYLRKLYSGAMNRDQKSSTIFYNLLKQTGHIDIPDDNEWRGGVLLMPAPITQEEWIARHAKKRPGIKEEDDSD